MKTKFNLFRFLLILSISIFITSCEKDEVVEPNDPVDEIVHPSVLTTKPTEITDNSAISGGNITDNGGSHIKQRGVVWNTTGNPRINVDNITHDGSTDGKFTSEITGLDYATTYYVRAYAINSEDPHKVGYGQEREFTTSSILPTVNTIEVFDIDLYSIKVKGEVTDDGGAPIISKGFVWSEEENPTLEENKGISDQGDGIGEFTNEIIELNRGTTYYVRAYATTETGTSYGGQIEFTTNTEKATIMTFDATNVTSNSAILSGQIEDTGGAGITEKGIYFSENSDPLSTGDKYVIENENDVFSKTFENLEHNTKYYFVAYAINSEGISYGEEKSFETEPTTAEVIFIDYNLHEEGLNGAWRVRISAEGEVTDDGGAEIIERGFVYRIFRIDNHDSADYENFQPTIDDDGNNDYKYFHETAEVGKYEITGMETYNRPIGGEPIVIKIRAYVINSAGVSYSETTETIIY